MTQDQLEALREWVRAEIALAMAEAHPMHNRVPGMDRVRDQAEHTFRMLSYHFDQDITGD